MNNEGFNGITVDFTSIELKVWAEYHEQMSNASREKWWMKIRTFPSLLRLAKFRKSRTRMMAQAVAQERHAVKGNIEVFYVYEPATFYCSYRDTLIAGWKVVENEFFPVHAGEYEDTASTRYQRRMFEEAVEEFNRVVMPCLA